MSTPPNEEDKPAKPRRAKGQTQTSISMSRSVLERARKAAESDRRSFSQWLEMLLEEHFQAEDGAQESAQVADSPPNLIEFPFIGSVAAGEPVEAERNEVLQISSDLSPDNHVIVEINGRSGEPKFMDGDRWLVEIFPGEPRTAKQGKPAVFRDKNGTYLKIYDGKSLRSVNPDFPDVEPSDGFELVGYPIERVDA